MHWLALLIIFWPLRYFYYNLESSCGVTARYTDVFICRMLIHMSFLIAYYCYASMIVLGFPFSIKNRIDIDVNIITKSALANGVLGCLSCLWFALFNSCGWWASAVALSFLNIYIAAFFTLAMTISGLIHRQQEYWINARAAFVEAYTQQQLSTYSYDICKPDKNNDGSSEEKKLSVTERLQRLVDVNTQRELLIKELDLEGDYFYDNLIDGICALYLWVPVNVQNTDGSGGTEIFQVAAEDYLRLAIMKNRNKYNH